MEKTTIRLLWLVCLMGAAICLKSCKEEVNPYSVFKYNLVNHPNSLDPAFAKSLSSMWISSHIFNTLVSTDENSQIIPSAAKSWEISEDGLEYSFVLKDNIEFHKHGCFGKDSTRILTAYDVEYSLKRILDTDVNSPGSWIFENNVAEQNPFEAKNDSVFLIKLKKPFRPMLSILTMQYCSIVPKEAVEYYGSDWKNNPIGSGPFKFKKWIKNQNLFLLKNDEYWSSLGNIDGIKIDFIVDRKIAFLELLNGNLDLVSGLESSFINEMLTPQGKLQNRHHDEITFVKSAYLNTEYIGINMELLEPDDPLHNKDFRKALNYGINKELMMKTLRNDVGHPANSGFTPKGLASFRDDLVGYPYDVEKANAHLNASGVDLQKMDPIVIYTNQPYADIMLFVSKQWEQLGIPTKIEVLESSILREGMRKGNIKLFRASWIGDYLDTENFMSVFYGKNNAPPNYTRFRNNEFDDLYGQSNLALDDENRNKIFRNMDSILIEESPVIFLFYDQSSNFYSKSIKGMQHSLNNLPFVENISKN